MAAKGVQAPGWRPSQQQRWSEKRVKEGKCQTCGKPRGELSRRWCDACVLKRRERAKVKPEKLTALSDPEPLKAPPVSPGELDGDSDEVTGGAVPPGDDKPVVVVTVPDAPAPPRENVAAVQPPVPADDFEAFVRRLRGES